MKKLLTILFILSFAFCQAQTRLYLNLNTAAAVSPTFNASWNVTSGASRYQLEIKKDGSTIASKTSGAAAVAAVRKLLIDQFVTRPLKAQTIASGSTLAMQARFNQSSTSSTTGQGFVYIRVCNSSGTITQDIGSASTTNLTTTLTNRTISYTFGSNITINDGDYFVFEFGWNYSVGTNTTRTGTMSRGSSNGTDLPVNNTATTANDPWIEFSQSLVFKGTTYYCAPAASGGSDGNPGTIGSPFANWEYFYNVAKAGDTCYIRGGTYLPVKAVSYNFHCWWQNMKGDSANPIRIWAYPGESPVYDFSSHVTTHTDPWGLYLDGCSYVWLRGLRVTGLAQVASGLGVSRGLALDASPHCTIERVEIDNFGGSGFVVGNNSSYAYFLNCDAHHLADPNSSGSEYGGADGYNVSGGVNSANTIFEGCRAYWCSDDGFDNFLTDGLVTYKNNWAFFNGYIPGTFTTGGNGEGYKLGPTQTAPLASISKILYNNLAFYNRSNGYSQNAAETRYTMYNNTSYKNGNHGFWFGWYSSWAQDFKNNISWDNGGSELDESGGNVGGSNNTWDGVVTVNNSDFVSIDTSGVRGSRGSNGELPVLDFLKLIAGSDLIDAGTNVSLPYYGSAPDIGAYESNYSSTRKKGRIFFFGWFVLFGIKRRKDKEEIIW